MASKNISIREDLYQRLSKIKEKNESFSDIIDRLLNEGLKGSPSRLMQFFGAWSNLPEDIFQNSGQFRNSFDANLQIRLKERFNDIHG